MKDIQDIGVRVTYKDKDLQPTYTKTYALSAYTGMLRTDLLRLITDIEDLCYSQNHGKDKSEWPEQTLESFNKIKHKILDKAGDIGRIPQNIIIRTSQPLSEYVASMLNEEG